MGHIYPIWLIYCFQRRKKYNNLCTRGVRRIFILYINYDFYYERTNIYNYFLNYIKIENRYCMTWSGN